MGPTLLERSSGLPATGKMPVPQENSLFVEQASCLFPIMSVRNRQDACSTQENSVFVEQASCLLPIMRPKKQIINRWGVAKILESDVF